MLKRGLLHLVLALCAMPALAAQGAHADAEAYAAAHQLKTRSVQIKLPGLAVTRTFVPVLPTTRDDFFTRFGEKRGGIVFRYGRDLEHLSVYFGPASGLVYAPFHHVPKQGKERFNDPDADRWVGNDMKSPTEGRYLALKLGADSVASLKTHWETVQPFASAKGGCMWWVVHAEVSPGQSLSHYLGVKRSSAPSNLMKKLIHAGNERVEIIGVAVNDLASFERMSEQDLLGPPPGGGALEAIKE